MTAEIEFIHSVLAFRYAVQIMRFTALLVFALRDYFCNLNQTKDDYKNNQLK